jgi:hypothetical protein
MLTRRHILAATSSAVPAAFVAAEAESTPTFPPLDLATPRANVRAFIKLLASLESETVYHTYEGTLEALLPGREMVNLIASTSVVRRQVELRPEGHPLDLPGKSGGTFW